MSAYLIDTHNHLQVKRFDSDREMIVNEAYALGIRDAIICSGDVSDFQNTINIAHQFGWHYTLGIHPLLVDNLQLNDAISFLNEAIVTNEKDPLFAGIGEIGLDAYVQTPSFTLQVDYFREQLKLARKYQLPVSVHARHAVDPVSKYLRELGPGKGVIHAFNGSIDQAKRLLALGYKLGFGGALTYDGSKRIRRIFSLLADTDFVLETDAPDMPSSTRSELDDSRTHIGDMANYARIASRLRNTSLEQLTEQSYRNTLEAFPTLIH